VAFFPLISFFGWKLEITLQPVRVNFIALTLINTDNWIDYIEINPSLPHIHQTQNKHVEQCVSFKYKYL